MQEKPTNTATSADKTFEQIREDIIRPLHKNTFWNQVWIRFLIVIIVLGTVAYGHQLVTGLGVTAMRDYSSWGLYISSFVFWVAVSLIGSLISAILKLLHQKWSNPLSRIAELIALAAIAMAAATIVIDMGRPDRVLHIPLHGRIQSPIVWDFFIVNTYLAISLILLYLPLIPDIAILRDRMTEAPKWQKKIYEVLSLGWKGTAEQWKLLKKSIKIMIILILPVAFSIHTVTSWLFAVNSRAGWHSTIFGPYFVIAAVYSGTGVLIIAMWLFRKIYRLEKYLTRKHFVNIGVLMLILAAFFGYFTFSEYLTKWYGSQKDDENLISLLMDKYFLMFIISNYVGVLMPLIVVGIPKFRTINMITITAVVVIIALWLNRYLIVIPTLESPYLPIQDARIDWVSYSGTWVEWALTIAGVAAFCLFFTIGARFIPIIPVSQEKEKRKNKEIL